LQLAQHTSLLNQLLAKLAKCNEEDKTPLVIEIIGNFIEYVDCDQLKLIAQVINKSISFTRAVEKIFALEFIGAALINGPILDYFSFALHCWKEAMTHRFFSQDGEPLPKQLAVCAPSTASSVVFGSADAKLWAKFSFMLLHLKCNFLLNCILLKKSNGCRRRIESRHLK
jgi:hypothetical protein